MTCARSAGKRIVSAAEQTTGDVLPSDGSINPGNAAQFAHLTQPARAHLSGLADGHSRSWTHSRDSKTKHSLRKESKACRMSLHAAAVAAGVDPPTTTIRTDDPDRVAVFLAKHFEPATIRAICDLALHRAEGAHLGHELGPRLDDNFPDHPKVLAAGPLAKALYIDALCYCNRMLTNGWVPAAMATRLAREYSEPTPRTIWSSG